MFVIAGVIIGALTGGFIAKRRKGKTVDILQYAAVYALIFGVAGMFITLFIHRSLI